MQDVCDDEKPDVGAMQSSSSQECEACGDTFVGAGEYCADCDEEEIEEPVEAEPTAKPEPTFKGGWGSKKGGISNHGDKRTVDAATVSEVAVERQEKHDRWLVDLGISRPPENISITKAGYNRGTAVVDYGYDSLEARRTEWENKPTVKMAVDTFVDILRREDRQDIEVPVSDLRMNDEGRIVVPSYGAISFEDHGLKSLLSSAKGIGMPILRRGDKEQGNLFPRAFSMFMSLDPDMRAQVFNEQINRHSDPENIVKLRTRKHKGIRSVFGSVAPTYSVYDADSVASFIADVLADEPQYRAEAQYNSDTTNFTMDVTMHAPSDLTDFSAGDLYEVGYRFKSNDRGGGSINGSAIAYWNECLNLIILHSEKSELVRVIHKGDVNAKMEATKAGMRSGYKAMERFAVDWGIIGETAVDGFEFNGERVDEVHHEESGLRVYSAPQAMLQALVDKGEIGDGLARDVAVQMLLESYQNQGGGDTLQDVINAVTRMAHEALVDDCARDKLEREAGLLVPVLAKQARDQAIA